MTSRSITMPASIAKWVRSHALKPSGRGVGSKMHSVPILKPAGVVRGRASVKTNERSADDERIGRKPLISMGIWHDHYVVLENGVAAEGSVTSCLASIEPDASLEPLPVIIDQRHGTGRDVGQALRQAYNIVEHALRCAVEHLVGGQFRQACSFIVGHGERMQVQAGSHVAIRSGSVY